VQERHRVETLAPGGAAKLARFPEGLAELEDDFHDRAHFQPVDGSALGRGEWRVECRPAGLEHAERERHQHRPCRERRQRDAVRRRSRNGRAPAAPLNRSCDVPQANFAAAGDAGGEVPEDAVVAAGQAELLLGPAEVLGALPLGEPPRADAAGGRRVEPLDEQRRQLPWPALDGATVLRQELFKGLVLRAARRECLREALEDVADLLPRVFDFPKATALEVPVLAVGVARKEVGAADDLEDFFRPAVHELGAELDRVGTTVLVKGVDAPADAVARFEDRDAEARGAQFRGRSQSRGAGAEDDHVAVGIAALHSCRSASIGFIRAAMTAG
jgi:hypothetical protein